MAATRDDEALLREIRERYDAACTAWEDIRREADTDMRYVGGDPWEPKDRDARQKAGRPCLSMDELNQYFNQTINDVRANPLSVRFSPRGGGANDTGAQFYQDKMREIEYRSRAQQAYTTAYENAVQRSFGYVRLRTKWVDDAGDDPWRQEIWIEPVPNPNSITPDPYFQRPDGSDLRFLFEEDLVPYEEFGREYPKAKAVSFSADLKALAPRWVKDRAITVANYWTVVVTRRTLTATKPNGEAVEREVEDREVWCYRTNGIEILRRTRWPGKYIPFGCCFGKVLWSTDGGETRRAILSMTRLARDPQMLYAYYRTCEAELVGMTPKFPYFAYKGTLDKAQKDLVALSLHEPVAVIEVEPTPEGVLPGTVMPLPQRQPYEPPIAALEVGAESARRAIQAAMGISPLPTDAQRRNQKSGVALQQIESNQQKGSYHFKDHYLDLITWVGTMVEDLMDKVYDTRTEVAVRRDDDTSASIMVNDPEDPQAVDTRGHYLVTVSAGPSFESTRAEAQDFLEKIAGIPQVFPLVAAEIVKLKQLGREGDRIADILDTLKPPQVQAMLAAKKQGQAPDPQQLMQMMQGMKQQLAEAEQVMQAMKSELDLNAAKQQADLQKAKLDAETKLQVQAMQDQTAIEVARINAAVRGLQVEAQRQTALESRVDAQTEAERARAHEAAMAALGHAADVESGDLEAQRQAALAEQQAAMQQEIPAEQTEDMSNE